MLDDDGRLPATSGEVVDVAYSGPGEWVAPAEAARRIGISERTLWRRVGAGLWQKRIVSGKAEVYVPVSGSPPDTGKPEEMALPAVPDNGLTLAVVHELRRRLEADGARVVEQAEQIGQLRAERDTALRQAAEDRAQLDRLRQRGWWARLRNALD